MKLLVFTMLGQLLQQNIRVNRDFIAGGPCHVLTIALAIYKKRNVAVYMSVDHFSIIYKNLSKEGFSVGHRFWLQVTKKSHFQALQPVTQGSWGVYVNAVI